MLGAVLHFTCQLKNFSFHGQAVSLITKVLRNLGFMMKSKKMLINAALMFALMFSLIAVQPIYAQPSQPDTSRACQKNLLKNWALSICFARIAIDERTKKDAGVTARAYLENSQQGVEDFEKIGKLVDKYIAMKYDGSDKSNYNTMKCIELFHSKELDRLTNSFVKGMR